MVSRAISELIFISIAVTAAVFVLQMFQSGAFVQSMMKQITIEHTDMIKTESVNYISISIKNSGSVELENLRAVLKIPVNSTIVDVEIPLASSRLSPGQNTQGSTYIEHTVKLGSSYIVEVTAVASDGSKSIASSAARARPG